MKIFCHYSEFFFVKPVEKFDKNIKAIETS